MWAINMIRLVVIRFQICIFDILNTAYQSEQAVIGLL